MILILIASIYITFLCWSWGVILLKLLQKITRERVLFLENFIITSFSGLALIGVVFGTVLFFLPLGGLTAHLCLALPAIAPWVLFKNTSDLFKVKYSEMFRSRHSVIVILLITYSVLILLMSVAPVIHPDTLNYHAQCIKWIEDYKIIPGLANLNYRYGLQSSWFILCALFSFKFTGFSSLTFLNSTVIFWLVFFVGDRINKCLLAKVDNPRKGIEAMMWLTLLIASFWSYTQVRLTLTSASPDFIVALYTWLIFFLILFPAKAERSPSILLLIVFLSLFAITIKLSAAPVLLLAIYYYFRYSFITKRMALWPPLISAIIVLTPALIRNIISSGYPLFPFAIADFYPADWKIAKETIFNQLNYISIYARVENIKIEDGNFTKWMPVWWHNRSMADKVTLLSFIALFTGNLLLLKKIKWQEYKKYLPALFLSLLGLLLWFWQAPDPRFGYGFLIASEGILLYFLSSHLFGSDLNKNWIKGSALLFSLVIVLYSGYRLTNFFETRNVILPTGVVKLPFKTIQCQGIQVNIPPDSIGCGDNKLPCVYGDCAGFLLRGDKISDGFKPANRKASVKVRAK